MKATYLWRTGPSSGRQSVVQGIQKIELGLGDLEVPGAPPGAACAYVTLEQGRCYLTNTNAPSPLTITRKVDGALKTIDVQPGGRVETKSHDVLSFGSGGAQLYCQYELEAADRFGFNLSDLPEAVSPVSADRRKLEVE